MLKQVRKDIKTLDTRQINAIFIKVQHDRLNNRHILYVDLGKKNILEYWTLTYITDTKKEYKISKALRLWIYRLYFVDCNINITLTSSMFINDYFKYRYDPLFIALYATLSFKRWNQPPEATLKLEDKKRFVVMNELMIYKNFEPPNELFIIGKPIFDLNFYRYLVFKGSLILNSCKRSEDDRVVPVLVKILTDGLATDGAFGSFLKKGVYDPRLWLYIFSFFEIKKFPCPNW